MAAKKKQGKRRTSAEFKRRSQAAKKGWETRKKNERQAAQAKRLAYLERATKSVAKTLIENVQREAKKKSRGKSKRSKAAIKGWATRRIKAIEAAVPKKKPRKPQTQKEKGRRIKELEAALELEKKKFVDLFQKTMLRDDGTASAHSSRLRLRPQEEKDAIREQMRRAREEGYVDETAEEIADFYGVEVREVYTLWYS